LKNPESFSLFRTLLLVVACEGAYETDENPDAIVDASEILDLLAMLGAWLVRILEEEGDGGMEPMSVVGASDSKDRFWW